MRCRATAAAALLGLTVARHGEADMAALVESASRPGLRQRIQAYREAARARGRRVTLAKGRGGAI